MSDELVVFLNFTFEKQQVTTKVLDDGGSSCSLATRWRINWRQYVAELAEVNVDCSSDARMYLAIYNTPQSSCQLFDELVDFQAKLRSQLSQLAATGKLSAALYNQIFRETDGLPVYISQNWTIQGDLNTKKFEALKIYYNFETHNYCHFILAILRDMLLKGTIFNIRTARDGEFYMASSWVPQPGYMDMEQGQESSEPTAKVDVLDNTEQIQLSDQPPKVIQATIISTKAELSVSLDLASEAIELTQAHKVIDDSSQALANELKLEDKASKTASIREQVVANMAALVSRLDRVERETTYKAPITLESSLSVSQASSSIEPSDLHFSVVAQERSFEPLLSKPLSVSQASESLLLDSVVFEPDEDINVNSQGFGSNKKSGKSFAQYLDRLKAAVEKKELVRSLNENSNEESQDYYEPLEDDGFFVEVWGSSLSDDESYVLEGFSAKSDFNRDPEEISKPNSESISSSISVINRFEKTQSLTEVNPSSAELMQELTLKSSPDLAIYISKEHKSSQVEESASDDSLLLIERLKSASEALSEAAATSISDVTSFEAIWPEADLGWGKVKAADVLSSLYDERKLPADNSQTEGKVIIETLADNIELEASMLERSRESEKKEERLEALTVSARSDLLEVKAPANSEGTF
ncbi:MAG: hypothetical protein LBV23_07735, partial [Deltaproteobacteria bacterium]|nr:hypothetical protein [Deltaproteobacteria bacterium]